MSDRVDWEAAVRPLLERAWALIKEMLDRFRDKLEKWLSGLLSGSIPENWREELARFVEETRADGLDIEPESIAALEGVLQGRFELQTRQRQSGVALALSPGFGAIRHQTGAGAQAAAPSTAMKSGVSSRPPRAVGGIFFNGDGERQNVVPVVNLQERQIHGKTWVYFQKEEGGAWFGVPKKTYFLHDAAGNLLNDPFGVPRSARDLTDAKPADWATSLSLNHPADPGWEKIAKAYGGIMPVDPEELREEINKSGEVTGPTARYIGKTIAYAMIAGAIGKGIAKGIGKGVEKLAGSAEREGIQQIAGQAAKAGEEAAGPAESALAKEAAEAAAAKTAGQAPSDVAGSARLEPYDGPGRGHHVPAKKAFEEAPGYNAKKAPAVPNDVLEKLNVNHKLVTGKQASLYSAFAKEGKSLTWEIMENIETKALVHGGMSQEQASATVKKAIQALKDAGINGPTRIPWGGG